MAVIVFTCCWVYFVFFTLYYYYELFKIWKFGVKIFERGKLVVDQQESWDLTRTSIEVGKVFETEFGKYIFIESNVCLFREKLFIPKMRVNSGLKLKGLAKFENGQVHVSGRLPLGMATAGWVWTVAWLIVPTVFISNNRHLGFSSFAVLIGLLFPVMFQSYVKLEKKRLLRVWDELRATLS